MQGGQHFSSTCFAVFGCYLHCCKKPGLIHASCFCLGILCSYLESGRSPATCNFGVDTCLQALLKAESQLRATETEADLLAEATGGLNSAAARAKAAALKHAASGHDKEVAAAARLIKQMKAAQLQAQQDAAEEQAAQQQQARCGPAVPISADCLLPVYASANACHFLFVHRLLYWSAHNCTHHEAIIQWLLGPSLLDDHENAAAGHLTDLSAVVKSCRAAVAASAAARQRLAASQSAIRQVKAEINAAAAKEQECRHQALLMLKGKMDEVQDGMARKAEKFRCVDPLLTTMMVDTTGEASNARGTCSLHFSLIRLKS